MLLFPCHSDQTVKSLVFIISLVLQLTTILQKPQLTRNYLYDNPTTANLYPWRPSFQFVMVLWGFFVCLFFASLKKIHWDCRRLIVLMALTLARSRLLRCSWKAAGLFSAAWRGRGDRRRNKRPRLMQFRQTEGSRDAPFSKQKCENLYGYSQRQTQSRSGFWQRRSGVLF